MTTSASRSIWCACGAQWHEPTVDSPQATAIIAKHHTGTGHRPMTHDEYRQEFGARCVCGTCKRARAAVWWKGRRRVRV